MKSREEIEEYIQQIKSQDIKTDIMSVMNYIQIKTLEWVLSD